MFVYEFPGIRKSKMPQPYTQLGDIYRNLGNLLKNQSKPLLPLKKISPKSPHQASPKTKQCPLTWCDNRYCVFQVDKQPSRVLAVVVGVQIQHASTEEGSVLDGAYTLHLCTVTELRVSVSHPQSEIIVLSNDCT